MRWRGYLSRLLEVSIKNGSILVYTNYTKENEIPLARNTEKKQICMKS